MVNGSISIAIIYSHNNLFSIADCRPIAMVVIVYVNIYINYLVQIFILIHDGIMTCVAETLIWRLENKVKCILANFCT